MYGGFGLSGDWHHGCAFAQDIANHIREVEGEGDDDREHYGYSSTTTKGHPPFRKYPAGVV